MNDFSNKLSEKWEEAKRFAKDPATKEKCEEVVSKVKTETVNLWEKTKEKLNEVKEDERLQDFIESASATIDDTIQTINESETYNKVKENVSSTFESIKNNEEVKQGVGKAKKATLSFAKKALNSIEKMLEDDKDESKEDVVIHEVKSEENQDPNS